MLKLNRKQFPSGYNPSDFTYKGRPAKDQGDFGTEVGICDAACVNQFGDANNAKYYHAGVVQTPDGKWWVYLEWGRIKSGKSWNGSFSGQDFQFVQCSSEAEARSFFSKQMASKNLARLQKKDMGGTTIWVSKTDKNGKSKDGYIVQSLATRERGLPDAYGIKDDTGIDTPKAKPKTAKKAPSAPSRNFHPQEVSLAQALVGGTISYARAASEATGVVPTMDSITKVRDDLLPLALKRIKAVGNSIDAQVADPDLIGISKMVAALVPTVIPRNASQSERERMTILSAENVIQRQNDLDAFEAALRNEDFEVEAAPQTVNPDQLLGAKIRWIEPKSDLGQWVAKTYLNMTNNRHGYIRGQFRIKGMYTVERPEKDSKFVAAVQRVAAKRKGVHFVERARLQPRSRPDVADIADVYQGANVFLGIHGTRPVNVHPIVSSNLRLPRQLKGVHISGAAFGHGIYTAVDIRKSYGYTGHGNAYWGGGGQISGRGFFMFLCDVIMGDPYMARSTGSWVTPPNGKDSVAAFPSAPGKHYCGTLANDEHIIFDPDYQRIRYIIEGELV